MQTLKALAAICGSILLGMLASTLVPGCHACRAAPCRLRRRSRSPSSGSLTNGRRSRRGRGGKPVEAVPVEGKAVGSINASRQAHRHAGKTSRRQRGSRPPPINWQQCPPATGTSGAARRSATTRPSATGIVTEWAPGEFDRKTGAWKQRRGQEHQVGRRARQPDLRQHGRRLGQGLRRHEQQQRLPEALSGRYRPGRASSASTRTTASSSGSIRAKSCPPAAFTTGRCMGICCSPLVEGDRLWFVTSRGEVRCLDVDGFYDGEDDGRPEKEEPARLFDVRRADDPAEDKVGGYREASSTAASCPPTCATRFAAAGMPLPEGDIAIDGRRQGQGAAQEVDVPGQGERRRPRLLSSRSRGPRAARRSRSSRPTTRTKPT